MDGLQDPHWRFSLDVYSQPGVSAACLELQEGLFLNVNVLLLSLYAAAVHGRAIEISEIARAHDVVAPWSAAVVEPLRALRRRLKIQTFQGLSAESARLRERVKAIELDAEYIGQRLLAEWVNELPTYAEDMNQASLRTTARNVVDFYVGRLDGGVAGRQFSEHVACIAGAAASVSICKPT